MTAGTFLQDLTEEHMQGEPISRLELDRTLAALGLHADKDDLRALLESFEPFPMSGVLLGRAIRLAARPRALTPPKGHARRHKNRGWLRKWLEDGARPNEDAERPRRMAAERRVFEETTRQVITNY